MTSTHRLDPAGVARVLAIAASFLLLTERGAADTPQAAGELVVLPGTGEDLALYTRAGERVRDYPLAPPSYDVVAAPDGRTIALPSTEGMFLLDVDTGAVRSLRSGAQVTAAAWRPDGSILAFEESDAVMIIDVVNGPPRLLVTASQITVGAGGSCGTQPAQSVSPAGWTASADQIIGRAVGYCAEQDQPLMELISIDPDDGTVRRLRDGVEAIAPVVEPGGDRVAFADDGEVVVIDIAGAVVA